MRAREFNILLYTSYIIYFLPLPTYSVSSVRLSFDVIHFVRSSPPAWLSINSFPGRAQVITPTKHDTQILYIYLVWTTTAAQEQQETIDRREEPPLLYISCYCCCFGLKFEAA